MHKCCLEVASRVGKRERMESVGTQEQRTPEELGSVTSQETGLDRRRKG